MLRSALVAALIVAAASFGVSRLDAQEPGDIYWQLVPRGIMADQRLQQALVLVTDLDSAAERAGVEGALRNGNPRMDEFIEEIEQDHAEAMILFQAAGFDPPGETVAEARRCRFWTPDEGSLLETRVKLGIALGEAMSEGLATLGIDIQTCERTTDQDAADLLIWEYGQDYAFPEDVYFIDEDSFIAANVERPGLIPGGGTGGAPDVSPPATGDAGLR
jgi:hypothetical protein